jgi:hypothetical protein
MNLREQILFEHSKAMMLKIVRYVGNDKDRFYQLMLLFLNGEYRLSQRAAWPVSNIAYEHPALIKPYFSKLITKLQSPGEHPSIPRNILRIFSTVDLPSRHHAVLIDICFSFIRSESAAVAIRAHAISVASRICALYPELKAEFDLLLSELNALPQTPAIRQRIRLALKEGRTGSRVK